MEHGRGSAYGDTSGGNVGIVEREGSAGEASNLYRDIHTQPGSQYHLSFDLSGLTSVTAASAAVEVWWEGQKIDTLTPADNTFGFVRHEYDLVATGDTSRIELRAVTQEGSGPVIDNPGMQFEGLTGLEATDLPMKRNMHLTDTDGSEVMGVTVKNLPAGFTLTDGTHAVTVANTGDTVSVQGWDMDQLRVTPPANLAGSVDVVVSATSTETANQDTASVDYPIRLTFQNVNDAPVVSAGDLGATAEETTRTFTAAELLQAVGASDPDGGTLSVASASVPASAGTIVDNADGTFTPTANFKGDDIAVSLEVTDGTDSVQASATLDVTQVTDAPAPTLTVAARQQVIAFSNTQASGVVHSDPMSNGGDMHQMTREFTILGGQQVATQGIHGATFVSYVIPGDENHMYVWKPEDMTIRVGGHEYATGVAMATDGADHRYTFIWDGTTGTLDVLVDGVPQAHQTGVGQAR